MKALILAAGRGSRMKLITEQKPKCLVQYNGKTILAWQTDALKKNGIDDISIVAGYRENLISNSSYRKIINKDWNKTNMVYSLMCAKDLLEEKGDLIVSYSDIIYESNVINNLIRTEGDIVVVVDKNWKRQWELRFDDPISDAESLRISQDGNITDIGQKVQKIEEIEAQYIGLIKLNEKGKESILNYYQTLTNITKDKGKINNFYMTDLLFGLIQSHIIVKACVIGGGWLEFDSEGDLKKYNHILSTNKLSQFINL